MLSLTGQIQAKVVMSKLNEIWLNDNQVDYFKSVLHKLIKWGEIRLWFK